MHSVDHADSKTFEAAVLLYVACGKLTDGDLAPAEAQRIVDLTHENSPGLSDSYVEQVIKDAAAALSQSDPDGSLARVVAAAEHLAQALSKTNQASLLDELSAITEADGAETADERAFVSAVAKTFRSGASD